MEDEVLVRLLLADELRSAGYKVIEAANANEALDVLAHGVDHPLVVVTDIRMPGPLDGETSINVVFSDIEMPGSVDGFGLAKWIRKQRPGVDVILTGTLPKSFDTAKELCAEGPVPKPYDAQQVHNQIRRLLQARKAAKPPT